MGLISLVFLAFFFLVSLSNSVSSTPDFDTLYATIQKQQHDSNLLNAIYAPFSSEILNSSQIYELLENQTNFRNGISLELVTKLYPLVEGKLKYDKGIKLPGIDLRSINLTVFHRYGDVYEIGKKMPTFFSSQGPRSAYLLKEEPDFTKHNEIVCGSAVPGEERVCVRSFKSMVRFVYRSMGTKLVKPISAAPGKWQLYTVTGLARTISNDVVGCHKLNVLPNAVYECHHIHNSTVRVVPLAGEDGTKVVAVSVCHMDTSSWTSQHPAFLSMDAKPGTPVCHFLATDDISWVTI